MREVVVGWAGRIGVEEWGVRRVGGLDRVGDGGVAETRE